MNRLITTLFVILLAGAFLFSLERVLFCDASFILFRIVNLGTLQIQEHRYGSFITQGVPLLATKMHLPLSLIVVLYSLSFNLFYLTVILLLLYKYREQSLALVMGFYFVLFVSDTYFWTNNEVHQGITWMFLFIGLILYLGKRKTSLWLIVPVFIILAFLSIFTHPLVLFPCLFLWAFFIMKEDWPYDRKWTIIFSIILLAFCFLKLKISTAGGTNYDSYKLHEATHLSFKKIFSSFYSPQAKEIVKRSVWNYWLVPVVFVAGLWSAYNQSKYRHLLLALCFAGGYFVALCITFNDFIPFYSESEWMPGTIITSTLFAFYTLPKIKPVASVALVAFIFTVRLGYIAASSQKFVERKGWTMGTLQTMRDQKIKKAIIYENDQNRKILIMNWGAPTESITASALAGDSPQLTFVVRTPESLEPRLVNDRHQMISCFEMLNNEMLNRKYFQFDSTTMYKVIQGPSVK